MPPGTSDYVARRSGRNRQPILRFDPSTYTNAAAERARAMGRGPPAARAPPPRRRVRRTAAEMARDMAQLTIGQQGSIMGHGRNVRVFIKHNPNGTRYTSGIDAFRAGKPCAEIFLLVVSATTYTVIYVIDLYLRNYNSGTPCNLCPSNPNDVPWAAAHADIMRFG